MGTERRLPSAGSTSTNLTTPVRVSGKLLVLVLHVAADAAGEPHVDVEVIQPEPADEVFSAGAISTDTAVCEPDDVDLSDYASIEVGRGLFSSPSQGNVGACQPVACCKRWRCLRVAATRRPKRHGRGPLAGGTKVRCCRVDHRWTGPGGRIALGAVARWRGHVNVDGVRSATKPRCGWADAGPHSAVRYARVAGRPCEPEPRVSAPCHAVL